MFISEEVFDRFKKITGYDAKSYFNDFINFIQIHYPSIVDYYSGNVKNPNSISFNLLNSLLEQSDLILNSFGLNKAAFEGVIYWNLLEEIEEVKNKLETVENISKYLRSPIQKNKFYTGIEIELPLLNTIENVVRKDLFDTNFNNSWADVAIYNDLSEEGYGKDKEGILLKAILNPVDSRFFLNSVIDNLQGEKLYGLDLNVQLLLIDDDLYVLTYKETIVQTISILTNLKKGDNPKFPNQGVSWGSNNISSLGFASIFRQMTDVFATDDTISSLVLVDILRKEDAVFMSTEVQTKYGEIFNQVKEI